MIKRTLVAALLCVAAFGAGACGDSDRVDPIEEFAKTPPPATTTPAASATTPKQAGGKDPIQKLEISDDLKTKPSIAKPSGEPPTKLYSRDIVKGKGEAAKSGDNLSVQYVGVSYSTGEEFDTSWGKPEQFSFPLGQGRVIEGWDEGVAGMSAGGRRLLVIPPDLAYKEAGQGDIGPNETLLFVIDLVKIA